MAPEMHGFYANVNPTVDHPRWSQARERRLPSFIPNHKTEMFNGYTEQVEYLCKGMDSAQKLKADYRRQGLCFAAALIPAAALAQGLYRTISWATSTLSPPTRATTSPTRPEPGRSRSSRSRSR